MKPPFLEAYFDDDFACETSILSIFWWWRFFRPWGGHLEHILMMTAFIERVRRPFWTYFDDDFTFFQRVRRPSWAYFDDDFEFFQHVRPPSQAYFDDFAFFLEREAAIMNIFWWWLRLFSVWGGHLEHFLMMTLPFFSALSGHFEHILIMTLHFSAREAAIWEQEEQQLHDKHQTAKRQLKDLFFLKRHQMLIRHEKVRKMQMFFYSYKYQFIDVY